MAPSMSRSYCPACDITFMVHHAWLHRQSATHKRNVDRLFPLPPSPWAKHAELLTVQPKVAHLGYLTTPSDGTSK